MRRIVCDTGPLLHLQEARVRDLLRFAGEIHIPIAVDQEMTKRDLLWPTQRPAWIRVAELDASSARGARAWQQAGLLHEGESQAIALSRQLKAEWFLTDDAAARLIAQSCGVEVHGSLGIVLWAAAAGHLNVAEADAALDRLAKSSLWLSPSVLQAAKAALAQMG